MPAGVNCAITEVCIQSWIYIFASSVLYMGSEDSSFIVQGEGFCSDAMIKSLLINEGSFYIYICVHDYICIYF